MSERVSVRLVRAAVVMLCDSGSGVTGANVSNAGRSTTAGVLCCRVIPEESRCAVLR